MNVYLGADDIQTGDLMFTTTTTGGTAGGGYYWAQPIPASNEIVIHSPRVEEKNMRHLFEITIVDPKTEEVTGPMLIVAKTEQEALLKAELPEKVRKNADDFDIIIDVVGNVRPKKETQKVKVVTEE